MTELHQKQPDQIGNNQEPPIQHLRRSGFVVVPAALEDITTIISFRNEAAQRPQLRQFDQWANPLSIELLTKRINEGKTWMIRDGEKSAATITLVDSGDHTLWTEEELSQPSLYIHKLSVAKEYTGNHLGAEILSWAEEQAAKQEKDWLRLDCWSSNPDLQAYYLRQNFTYLRTIPNRISGALFQKAIAR